MASIKKRSWTDKNGNLKTGWRGRFVGIDGKVHSVSAATKTAVQEKIDALQSEKRIGVVSDKNATVSELCDIWLAACKIGRNGRDPVEPHTLRSYQTHVDLHIKPRIGGVRIRELTPPFCEAFRGKLLSEMSRANSKKVLGSFKAILAEARGKGLMAFDPAETVSIVTTGRRKALARPVIPSKEEMREMLSAADRLAKSNDLRRQKAWKRYRPMVYTIALTGVRVSELRGLPRKAVGLDSKILAVMQRADETGVIGPPKSASGYRKIEIPEILVEILKDWLHEKECDLVFPNGKGKPESGANLHTRLIGPLMEAADLGIDEKTGLKKRYNLKSFRHFRASMLIASGATVKEVQAQMGHATAAMTLDVYGHLFPDDSLERHERAKAIAEELSA